MQERIIIDDEESAEILENGGIVMAGYGYHMLKSMALSVGESMEFMGRINKQGERSCLMCGVKFQSKGYHNRRCPKCDVKIEYAERMNVTREPIVYRTHTSGVRSTNNFYRQE